MSRFATSTTLAAVAAAVLLACGCGSPAKTGSSPSPASDTHTDATVPPAQPPANPGSPPPAAPPAKSDQAAEASSKLPAQLKHEGYRYWGLGSAETVRMTITNSAERRTTTSEQTTKLVKVVGGVATFSSEVTEGGSLAMTILWTVKPDGVYARQKGAGADDKPQLQIPAEITPGKTWTAKEKYMIGGVAATTVMSNRIVGFDDIKTARGPFKALVVESMGTFYQAGEKPGKIETKTWLVRDLGTVRVEMTLRTPKSKQPVKLVSEIR